MGSAPNTLSLRSYGAARDRHAHDHFQALVGLDGVLELEVEGRGQRIGAGQALLVMPGERHEFESAGGSRCLVLDTQNPLWSRCTVQPAHPAQLQSLARYLGLALLANQPLAAMHGPSLLLEAWQPKQTSQRVARSIDWPALAAWTQERLHQPLSVADLAAQVFLSPSQFAQRCRQAHGVGPMHWLRLHRLACARQLKDSGMAVAQVARRTGYRSPSALTAALRRCLA